MKRSVVLASLILATLLPTAYSANVTVIAEGVFSEYSDPDALLPFSEPAPGTVFTLQFTYDDSTFDSFPSVPTLGHYIDPMSASILHIGADSYGLYDTTRINVGNDIFDSAPSEYLDTWWTSNNKTAAAIGDIESYGMSLNSSSPTAPATPLTSTDLVPPEWPSDWNTGTISYQVTNAAHTLAFARATITSVTVVPIPTAIWLFGSALGLLGWARRKLA